AAVEREIEELLHFKTLASSIQDDAKGQALLIALERAFIALEELGAPKKAIIFTESKRTQAYLLSLLENTHYGEGIVLFNGTNTDARAQAVYKAWMERHKGSDRISGSKTADTRAALVEHFKENGTVMIATEAGAEGINLQFCSLVINYDLPWNPQRIEQRIGRCHRYGQKFDVVVVNFVDRTNEADKRVYELLEQKFQLFEGVFGASDEVLGTIGSGVDFERRIAEIYQKCRKHDEIQEAFTQLQQDLSGEISETVVKMRRLVFENFDEEVHAKLRLQQAEDSKNTRSCFEHMLMDLTRTELADYARFDDQGFNLHRLPESSAESQINSEEAPARHPIELGRYELPRRSGESHLYRIGHPLAARITQQAKERVLPAARLIFDYETYGKRISTLEPYRGQSGWLALQLITVEALGSQEEHLLVAAITRQGQVLEADDPEKLLRLPAKLGAAGVWNADPNLADNMVERKMAALKDINQRNLGYFNQEVEKLDAWADDMKLGLEQEIKAIDLEIKEVRRTATIAPTLDEKLSWQKRQRELEAKRNKLRRELYTRQDDIEAERNRLIDELEAQLRQEVGEQVLFTIEWELV
ncbi:MAG: helicase-related protein, partial [Azovibrio sp.]